MDLPSNDICAEAQTFYAWRCYRSRDRRWELAVTRDIYGDIRGTIWADGHGQVYARAAGHVSPAAMVAHLNDLAHHGAMIIPPALMSLMTGTPLRLGDGGPAESRDVHTLCEVLFC